MTTKAAKKDRIAELGLVGRCFVRIGDDGFWNNQGVIRGEPVPGYYLCQYFSCIDGSPTDLTIFKIDAFLNKPSREPGSFLLFEDDEHLRFWIEHRAPRRDSPAAE